jgi:hypothetical protein
MPQKLARAPLTTVAANDVAALRADGVPYTMRISRLTIDKLGVKLYDAVSAVVAELIANGYDADAELVTVRLPLNTLLARKTAAGIEDTGYVVEVEDDGHGMTPAEAIRDFLEVGRDRRAHAEQGKYSRDKNRSVMGRKGIGKLAPFGICRRIELMSAGGPQTDQGFLVTHFFMDYDRIVVDEESAVQLEAGSEDRKFSPNRGTTIRLHTFLHKRAPDADTFHRQLARRFAFARPDFKIVVEDTRDPASNPPKGVQPLSIPLMDGARIDLATRPITADDGAVLPVSGWIGLAKEAYKNEEMAGVRIYARGKIVATTRDFEQPAGYTGEFTTRSYLVGEVHAEWLDLDDGEDLVRTDRQGIVWDSEYGRALRAWGAGLIREIGTMARNPRRARVRTMFLERANIAERAKQRYASHPDIVDVALELAGLIGGFAAEDELEDDSYMDGLCEVVLAVAPHKALIQAFQKYNELIAGGEASLEDLLSLFNKTRVAEMASYSQIAAERVRIIGQLDQIVFGDQDEAELQRLIAGAPWLIEPTWSIITKNQTLRTFKRAFEQYWKKEKGEEITLAIEPTAQRPDFTLVSVGHMLHIIEIKASAHVFDDDDLDRMLGYVDAFEDFFERHSEFNDEFSAGWRIDLVTDSVRLKKSSNRRAFRALEEKDAVRRISWVTFLKRTKVAHEMFLAASDNAQKLLSPPQPSAETQAISLVARQTPSGGDSRRPSARKQRRRKGRTRGKRGRA